MVLIKAKDVQYEPAKAQIFNLRDIAVEAQQLLNAAKLKASKMIQQAENQIELARQQAVEQGRKEGLQKGLDEGKQQGLQQALDQAKADFDLKTKNTLDVLNQILNNFEQNKQQILFQAEQHSVQLATAIAEKVTHQLGKINPDVAAENVKSALKMIAHATDVVIKVHPNVLDHIENMNTHHEFAANLSSITFEKDPSITPGGCVVNTAQGAIDAQLETQLQRIADELVMSTNQTDTDKQN